MEHVMVDLETLGRTPDAPIIAIGAVYFDPVTGEMDEGREWAIDFDSACEGRPPEGNTVAWWLKQSEDARVNVLRGDKLMGQALEGLSKYVQVSLSAPEILDDLRVWGNGALFDIAMLEDCYRQYNYEIPWPFWGVRDVRTIRDLAHPQIDPKAYPFEGTKHSALADARHQARYVSDMWRVARSGFAGFVCR